MSFARAPLRLGYRPGEDDDEPAPPLVPPWLVELGKATAAAVATAAATAATNELIERFKRPPPPPAECRPPTASCKDPAP